MAGGQGSTMAGASASDLEEKIAAVKAKAEATGIMWDDLSPEQKKDLYRDYTGEEIALEKMEEFVNKGSGGTQAGRIFVADNPFEGIASLGAAYKGKKKREELSKQKARAYELAGGLAAGEVNSTRQHQQNMLNTLTEKSKPPPAPPPQGGPTPAVPGGAGAPPPTGGPPPQAPQGGPPPMPAPGQSPRQNASAAQATAMQRPPGMGNVPLAGSFGQGGGGNPGAPPEGMPSGPGPGNMTKEMMKRKKLEEMMRLLRGS